MTSQVVAWNIFERKVGDILEIACDNISLVGKFVLNREIRDRFKNVWTFQSDVSFAAINVTDGSLKLTGADVVAMS